MSNQAVSVYAEALKRHQKETEDASTRLSTSKSTRESTSPITYPRDKSRKVSRDLSRDKSRKTPRKGKKDHVSTLPTRDEIQGFSFLLRDELRVKVQAEVPPDWQTELDDIASKLNVKKLELYRYIIGEFLGKVEREQAT